MCAHNLTSYVHIVNLTPGLFLYSQPNSTRGIRDGYWYDISKVYIGIHFK